MVPGTTLAPADPLGQVKLRKSARTSVTTNKSLSKHTDHTAHQPSRPLVRVRDRGRDGDRRERKPRIMSPLGKNPYSLMTKPYDTSLKQYTPTFIRAQNKSDLACTGRFTAGDYHISLGCR